MDTVQEGHTEVEAAGPSLFSRYIAVFFSPDRLFQGLRSRPHWVGAWLLGASLAAAGTMLIPPELTLATIREQMVSQGQPVPSVFTEQAGWLRFAIGAAPLIFWGILLSIYAGLVMLFFAFLMGHEGTYRQYLAVVAHAHLVAATSTILLVPLRIVGEDAQILLSVGSFAFFLDDGYWFRFLGFLDLFGLWSWMLVGLGAARIGRKESWWFGAVAVMMIPVTMAALFAIFAP